MLPNERPHVRPANLCWSYRSIPPRGSVTGWLAGPVVWAVTHWLGQSRPCRRWATRGQIDCEHCSEHARRTRWLGYLPLFETRGQQHVYGLADTHAARLDNIAVGTQLTLGRTGGKTDPIWVHIATGSDLVKRPPTLLERFKVIGDLGPWLLQLWKDPVLDRFFADVEKPVPQARAGSTRIQKADYRSEAEKLEAMRIGNLPAELLTAEEAVEHRRILDFLLPRRANP